MKLCNWYCGWQKKTQRGGYDHIVGAIQNLKQSVSNQSVANILKQHGSEPTTNRKRAMSWRTFLKVHWDVLGAIDFTTVEVWTKRGLVTFYVLFSIELNTRCVLLVGCTTQRNEAWVKQARRELTNFEDGFLNDKRSLIMDRDTEYTDSFRSIMHQSDITSVVQPSKSPSMNAYVERFM